MFLVMFLVVQGEGGRVRRVVGGRKAAAHRFPWQVRQLRGCTDDCTETTTSSHILPTECVS